MSNKREAHQALCLPPPGWGCPPGIPSRAWKPPSPHPWRLLLATRTRPLEFSARTRRCCSGWRLKPRPEGIAEKKGLTSLDLEALTDETRVGEGGPTSTARVAPEELCRMWKRRLLAAWVCPDLAEVPPRWMIMGLPWNRLIRCAGSCP